MKPPLDGLKEAWDAYDHAIPWTSLHDYKSDRGCYVVVCWKNEDGTFSLADLARGGRGAPWEMQNDGFTHDITQADWRKLRIVPDCDWFEIPGNEHYERL